jgi:glycosyltransferase involved in cell wall biosynthesis
VDGDLHLAGRRLRRPRISVVIPVRDDATHLEVCLTALAAQTRLPDEIIVVDNGSSDASAVVASTAGATVVDCEEPGIPAASSCGYDAAAGDLILRLDADCVPPPSWIEQVEAAFAERPEVSAFTGGARFVDGPALLRRPLAHAYLLVYTAMTAPALGHLPLFGSNLAMRADASQSIRSRVHRHDPEVHDDLDLAFHLGARHRVGHLRGTRMGVSMRPFQSGAGSFVRRVRRGFRTVVRHWPHDFPPLRWRRIARTRRSPCRAGSG